MTDALIVRQAQQGDTAAYEELVRRYEMVAFRTAWLLLGDPEDARDATQTAFLKAWLHIGRVDETRSFKPWLLAIVANEARNRRRARGRWLARILPEDRVELLVESGLTPEHQIEQQDEAEAVLRELAAMDESDRVTLWCRYVLDLTERETAEVMECPVGTVKSRTHRAMERLRARLRDCGMLDETANGGGRDD